MIVDGEPRRIPTWLRRLRLLGLLAPIPLVVLMHVLHPLFQQRFGDSGGRTAVGLATLAASVAFTVIMFHLIFSGHRTILEQNRRLEAAVAELSRRTVEEQAVSSILDSIGRRAPLPATLGLVFEAAREQLGASHLGPIINGSDTSWTRRANAAVSAETSTPAGTTFSLWVAARAGRRLDAHERDFLDTLGELATLAIEHAEMITRDQDCAAVAERERLARELHDTLAQVLSATHLRLRALDWHPALTGAGDVRGEINAIADGCQEAHRDVREAILSLRNASLADLDLLDVLDRHARQFTRTSGIQTSVHSTLDDASGLASNTRTQVVRVVQEALTNVRRHSGASNATVTVEKSELGMRFLIADDGCGFDPDEHRYSTDGFGLVSMADRVASVGGRFTVASEPGRGTRVSVEVPCRAEQELDSWLGEPMARADR